MKKQSAQVKMQDREPKDPTVCIGISFPVPSTGNPVILRYREAQKALDVIGEAFHDVKMNRKERREVDKAVATLMLSLLDARQKIGGEGLPLKLSRMWPQFNDDGSRKDENAPDPTPGKMEDRGQGAKAVKPSREHSNSRRNLRQLNRK